MLLHETQQQLGWPSREQILHPAGFGAKVYAEFAERKIAAELRRRFPHVQVHTGILAADPNSDSSEAPIAVVCEFPAGASDAEMDEAHRLAWNFSRTALLITLEPHRLIAWSCCQHPKESLQNRQVCQLPSALGGSSSGDSQQKAVRNLLHWVSLLTGNVFRKKPQKFPADGRADALLLKNLKVIRRQLINLSLPKDYCHDLLARVIFTQFLFHRKDSDGRAFFDERLLQGRCEGVLQKSHNDFASILADKKDTYALFRWLDDKFNGDLFPGKENQPSQEREQAWQQEKDAVNEDHLRLLAQLVSGTLDVRDQQMLLWPQYSFDTIPLEFISSVYEEFLNEDRDRNRAYYTPPHLVDFVLDAVLPWNGTDWDLKILDPCCGSGIFLVKAFQRLIYRWRLAHPKQEPRVSDLKPILADNLVGVDKNPEAVRVACFSLYLTLADAIEPKYYLKRERVFPRLRGSRLITKDFFDESTQGFRTEADADAYHFVLGNAPWGDGSIKETSDLVSVVQAETPVTNISPTKKRKKKEKPLTQAQAWAINHSWPVANYDIGPLFLAKSLSLIKEDGRVAMIQPAPPWLYLRSDPAKELRKKLFLEFLVDEVTNLSALRKELFAAAVGSACVISLGKQKPKPDQILLYFSPKPLHDNQGQQRFVIEPHDVHRVTHLEAATVPFLWSCLALGGKRDLALLLRLHHTSSLKALEEEKKTMSRSGVIPGNKKQELPQFKDVAYFDATKLPGHVFLELNADEIAPWGTPQIDERGSTDFEAFKKPQLLIKQSLTVKERRFRAAVVDSSNKDWGTICKETYLSIRDLSPDGHNIRLACLVYNSVFATYYLGLTSTRLGHYRPEVLVAELLSVPLRPAEQTNENLPDLNSFASLDEIDPWIRKWLKLTQADWTLVEDFFEMTLPGVLSKKARTGYKPTFRQGKKGQRESELRIYCQYFIKVLQSTFGKDKAVCATLFTEPPGSEYLPVRMVAIHLHWPGHDPVKEECMETDGLMDSLNKLYAKSLLQRSRATTNDGLGFQRVAFLFQPHQESHGRVQSLYIIKPDERRYWTRSLAMRDADQLSSAILKAA